MAIRQKYTCRNDTIPVYLTVLMVLLEEGRPEEDACYRYNLAQ